MKRMFFIIISISVASSSLGMGFNRERDYYGYEKPLRFIDNSITKTNMEHQTLYLSNQELAACPLISSPDAWNELKLEMSSYANFIPLQPLEQRPLLTRKFQTELSLNTFEWDKYINWDPEKPFISLLTETPKITSKKSTDSQLIDSIPPESYPSDVLQFKVAGNSAEKLSCFIPVNPQLISPNLDYMPQLQSESNSTENSSCFIPVNPQPPTLHFESNSTERSSESSSSNIYQSPQFKQIYRKRHKKRPRSGIRSYERLSLARCLTPAFVKKGYQNVFCISTSTANNDIAYGLASGMIKEVQSQYQGMYVFTKPNKKTE